MQEEMFSKIGNILQERHYKISTFADNCIKNLHVTVFSLGKKRSRRKFICSKYEDILAIFLIFLCWVLISENF